MRMCTEHKPLRVVRTAQHYTNLAVRHVIQGGTRRSVPYRHSQQGKWSLGLQRRGPTGLIIQPHPCPSSQRTLSGDGLMDQTVVSAHRADQALPLTNTTTQC